MLVNRCVLVVWCLVVAVCCSCAAGYVVIRVCVVRGVNCLLVAVRVLVAGCC